jgi:hypothetical protein
MRHVCAPRHFEATRPLRDSPPFAVERPVLAGAVFLFEQTAMFVPYLFPELPDLKGIFPISPALVAGLFA